MWRGSNNFEAGRNRSEKWCHFNGDGGGVLGDPAILKTLSFESANFEPHVLYLIALFN